MEISWKRAICCADLSGIGHKANFKPARSASVPLDHLPAYLYDRLTDLVEFVARREAKKGSRGEVPCQGFGDEIPIVLLREAP